MPLLYCVLPSGQVHRPDDAAADGPGRRPVYNMATCLKDPVFLDFFFRRLRVNDLAAGQAQAHRANGYGHVSPCGMELNFLKAADSAAVFSRLSENRLFYAPSLYVPYDKTALTVCLTSGRVYHPAPAFLGEACAQRVAIAQFVCAQCSRQ